MPVAVCVQMGNPLVTVESIHICVLVTQHGALMRSTSQVFAARGAADSLSPVFSDRGAANSIGPVSAGREADDKPCHGNTIWQSFQLYFCLT
jgi:hypothetical protein